MMLRRLALIFGVLSFAGVVHAAEFNVGLEYPVGLSADVWVTPGLSIGVEGPHSEIARGTKSDPTTTTGRRSSITRQSLFGVRGQLRFSSSLADATVAQLAFGMVNLEGSLESGALTDNLTGEASTTYGRLMIGQRWEWPHMFFQAGIGVRFEGDGKVKVSNSTREDSVAETPNLGGAVIGLALGVRF